MRSLRLLRCRPCSTRMFALVIVILGFGVYCYYYTISPAYPKPVNPSFEVEASGLRRQDSINSEQCPVVRENAADIDTMAIYPTFDFQPSWLRTKEFWDKSFEERYENMKNDSRRPRLKVIVVPHSHNDPGWLMTFESYFETKTKNIINNIVQKLHEYNNMTFIWTEISFLNAWWERSHPVKQKAFKKLIKEGRLEITTGGWVMPDEACTHIYALVDQFIEGHQWVKTNLGVTPKTGWSIDPFGHGATVPYLLDQSGLEGTIIQRIHYAWKQWLAQRQIEEFYWIASWSQKKPSLIVHNMPFDIYSIKSTCGPHPAVCLGFDFRKIPGEYSEYTAKYEEITDQNVHSKSKTLIDEYDRIGSLTPHNVILVPLGDDFRYEYGLEFDAQYKNYMKMFTHINKHKHVFNADVSFGTPLDYFNAIKQRHSNIPTLKGDFFVYSDIFSEGKPAYWSGYYTTRPYLKILARQFEHHLRSAEILFTLVSNHIKQSKDKKKLVASEKRLEKFYEQLITARRNLGLFQHHDAITGTSKSSVMYDYGTKLFTSIYHCIRLQEIALNIMMLSDPALHSQSVLQSQTEWETYGKQPKQLQVSPTDKKKIVLFNSLTNARTEVVSVKSNTTNVRVFDTRLKEYVPYQIAPNIVSSGKKFIISESVFDVIFVATLPPLSAVTFNLEEHVNASHHCEIFCNNCSDKIEGNERIFPVKKMMPGDIQLENSVMKLLIDRNNGLLRQINRKDTRRRHVVEIQFGAYQSAQRHSGAYLFMPDYDAPEKDVLHPYASGGSMQDENIIIVSGPVATEVNTLYLPFLVHTLRIHNVDDHDLLRAIRIENFVDFESPPKNRETELFMRIQTNIQNGDIPEFYTDQNGFQYQKRVKVNKLGIEGNYYPITTMAWLQDEEARLTLLTNHAQGAAAYEPGRLEVMLDRRTLYDDHRGIGEGVVDNKPTLFEHWLLLEPTGTGASSDRRKRAAEARVSGVVVEHRPTHYELPSRTAARRSRALNYPPGVFVVDASEAGGAGGGEVSVKAHRALATAFPADVHLVTLRTLSDAALEQVPSAACLMVLQRVGYTCSLREDARHAERVDARFSRDTAFTGLRVTNLTAVSLTGLVTHRDLAGFEEVEVAPLEIKTFKIKF